MKKGSTSKLCTIVLRHLNTYNLVTDDDLKLKQVQILPLPYTLVIYTVGEK